LRIENRKLKVALMIILAVGALGWGTLHATSAPAEKTFRYEDRRLGELKDESDKFKFVRVKLALVRFV